MRQRLQVLLVVAALGVPLSAWADGPLGIDHHVAYDNSGIWKRSY